MFSEVPQELTSRQRSIKKHNLKARYGLTVEEYEALKKQFEGKCGACGSEGALCVDHCHKTSRVRGILCNSCNSALGHLKESVTRVAKLLLYMERIK